MNLRGDQIQEKFYTVKNNFNFCCSLTGRTENRNSQTIKKNNKVNKLIKVTLASQNFQPNITAMPNQDQNHQIKSQFHGINIISLKNRRKISNRFSFLQSDQRKILSLTNKKDSKQQLESKKYPCTEQLSEKNNNLTNSHWEHGPWLSYNIHQSKYSSNKKQINKNENALTDNQITQIQKLNGKKVLHLRGKSLKK